MLRRMLSGARTLWLMAGLGLFYVLALEGALRGALRLREAARPEPALSDAYRGAAWAAEYERERARSWENRWDPYVYLRRRPFAGKYLNVNEDGLRVTWSAPLRPGARPLRVYVLGGSAVFGIGARDDHTIPSLLAQRLAAGGVDARVTNLGRSGFVSTQEIIELVRRLQREDRPDVLVVYGGSNDVLSAYQTGAAGLPVNEEKRADAFEALRRPFSAITKPDWFRGTAIYRVAARLVGIAPHVAEKGALRDRGEDPAALPARVARAYVTNARIVSGLARDFRFRALTYLQPTIFQKQRLSASERKARHDFEAAASFYEKTYTELRRQGGSDVHDLSGLFAERGEPYFLDWVHVSEAGNELVADRLYDDIRASLGPPRAGLISRARPAGKPPRTPSSSPAAPKAARRA